MTMLKYSLGMLTALLLPASALALDSILPWKTVQEAGNSRTQLHTVARALQLTSIDALTLDYFHLLLTADSQGAQHRLGAAVFNCGNGSMSEVALDDAPLDAERQVRDYGGMRTRVALEMLHHAPRMKMLEERIRQGQLAEPQNSREAALLQEACRVFFEPRQHPVVGDYLAHKIRHNDVRALPGSKQALVLQADNQSVSEADAGRRWQRFYLPLSQTSGELRLEVQEVLLQANGTQAAGTRLTHWQDIRCTTGEMRQLRNVRPAQALGEGSGLRYLNLSFRHPAITAREDTLATTLEQQPWQPLDIVDHAYGTKLQELCDRALQPRVSNLYASVRLRSGADANLARTQPAEWSTFDIATSYFQDPLPVAAYDCRVVQPPSGVSHELYRNFENTLTTFANCDSTFIASVKALYDAPEPLLREHDRRRFQPAHREVALNTLRARLQNLVDIRQEAHPLPRRLRQLGCQRRAVNIHMW
jgi:hypothetical protein